MTQQFSDRGAALVMSLEEACRWRDNLRLEGRKLVVTNGCFDILHRGHAAYLANARARGDALLVLINSDAAVRALKGPTRPVNDEYSRAYLIASLKAVDAAVVFDSERCDRELAALAPDIYAKGGDYTVATLNPLERAALLSVRANICFIPFVDGFSTSNIIRKMST